MLVHVILFLQAPAPCRWRRWCPWTTSGMPICRFVVERLSEWTESGQIISTQHVLIYGNPILTQRLLEHRPDYDEKVHAMPTRGWGRWHYGLIARNNVHIKMYMFTFTIKWYLQSVRCYQCWPMKEGKDYITGINNQWTVGSWRQATNEY